MSAATKYAVRCDDYTTRPYRSREVAQGQIEDIERIGACSNEHEVVEVVEGDLR